MMLKESTLLKGNLCIYKCFMEVLYISYRAFKINWEMRPIWHKFLPCAHADFTCGNRSTIQSVLRELLLTVNLWVVEKIFQETICPFIDFCLFIHNISW